MAHLEHADVRFVYSGQPEEEIPGDITHLSVANTIRRLPEGAFEGFHYLRSIDTRGLEFISWLAFGSCFRLVNVRLGPGLTQIGAAAFYRCTSLTNIVFPQGLNAIFAGAFRECESLSRVSIPSSVIRIGDEAFFMCSALTEVEFAVPGRLRQIDASAFESCTALSAVALPPTLESLGNRAFFGCFGLLGVETCPNLGGRLGDNCFAHCKALVNISFCNIGFGRDISHNYFEGCELLLCNEMTDDISHIPGRFARLPVHTACYYSSMFRSDLGFQVLANSLKNEHVMEDSYGMTPFHILATSPNLNATVLECLLDRYPAELSEHRDIHGKTMMNYLFDHTSSKSVPLLKMMLERTIIIKMEGWGLAGNQHTELLGFLESIHGEDDIDARRKSIRAFFRYVGKWVRQEMTFLLELALWKVAIMASDDDDNDDPIHRANCRNQSRGSDVVMQNAIPFLWGEDEPRAFTALWLFPVWYHSTESSTDDNMGNGGDFDSEYENESVPDSEFSFDSSVSDHIEEEE